jgi:hypothetical protein
MKHQNNMWLNTLIIHTFTFVGNHKCISDRSINVKINFRPYVQALDLIISWNKIILSYNNFCSLTCHLDHYKALFLIHN